jgi:hypothetical protein
MTTPDPNKVEVNLPAQGLIFPAWGYRLASGKVCLRFIDFIETTPGNWVSGWVYWPEMARAGLLEVGAIIPGTYGDFPIYITDQAQRECAA